MRPLKYRRKPLHEIAPSGTRQGDVRTVCPSTACKAQIQPSCNLLGLNLDPVNGRRLQNDSEAADNMYERDPSLPAGESAEEETEDSIMSPIPVGPPSPLPNNQDFTPKEGSPYEVPVYIPDDIPIPGDLELRESSVPGAGLGIWAKAKIRLGERFGPYSGTRSAAVKETTFGWEGTSGHAILKRVKNKQRVPSEAELMVFTLLSRNLARAVLLRVCALP